MWFERFVIVMSTANDFLPSSWDYYSPTFWDVSLYIGTMGIFGTLFLLFLRFVPAIAIAEVKAIKPGAQPPHHALHDDHGADAPAADHAPASAH
jgi:molybdopterin-containing oxidoreductase family membrane subunit